MNGKLRMKKFLKFPKALEVQTVKTKVAKNKAKVVANVMKDGLVNPPIDEESVVVVSKKESIPVAHQEIRER